LVDEPTISNYYHLNEQVEQLRDEVRHFVNQPVYILPFLLPGRLVRVRQSRHRDWGWGVVVNFQKVQPGSKTQASTLLADAATSNAAAAAPSSADEPQYVVDILLRCRCRGGTDASSSTTTTAASSSSSSSSSSLPEPLSLVEEVAGGASELLVIPVLLPLLNGVSSIRIYIPKDLRSPESRRTVANSLREVHRRYPDGLPLLDPVSDLRIKDATFARHHRKIEALEERLAAHPLLAGEESSAHADHHSSKSSKSSADTGTDIVTGAAQLSEESRASLLRYADKMAMAAEAKEVRRHLRRADTVIMKEELKSMQRVLRRLGHINRENVIDVKGRVTCEINANDELLLTELMFSGSFTTLSPSQIASLLSCFVFQEKGGQNQRMREELAEPLRRLHEQVCMMVVRGVV
jgi:ATP-dependent RNA helicase DOB1